MAAVLPMRRTTQSDFRRVGDTRLLAYHAAPGAWRLTVDGTFTDISLEEQWIEDNGFLASPFPTLRALALAVSAADALNPLPRLTQAKAKSRKDGGYVTSDGCWIIRKTWAGRWELIAHQTGWGYDAELPQAFGLNGSTWPTLRIARGVLAKLGAPSIPT